MQFCHTLPSSFYFPLLIPPLQAQLHRDFYKECISKILSRGQDAIVQIPPSQTVTWTDDSLLVIDRGKSLSWLWWTQLIYEPQMADIKVW